MGTPASSAILVGPGARRTIVARPFSCHRETYTDA